MGLAASHTSVLVPLVMGLVGLVLGSLIGEGAWCYMCGRSAVQDSLQTVVPRWIRVVAPVACGCALAALVRRFGLTTEAVELGAFSCVLLFVSLTDLIGYLIPNACVVAAVAIRVAYLALAWVRGAVGANAIGYYAASALGVGAWLLVTVLICDHLFGKESMGGGDLKLFAVGALYFGWQRSLFLVFVSCLFGLLTALLAQRSHPSSGDGFQPFPFGPSIALACVITGLIGELGPYRSLLMM